MSRSAEELLASLDGPTSAVFVVAGELVLAEPAALRLAEGLAEKAGCRLQVHRHPPRLAPLLADLRTFSLFEPAKVVLAVDTAVLADKSVAADLLDQAVEVLPLPGDELGSRERAAASRLIQALRLFGGDPAAGEPAAVLEGLPDWAFEGGAAFRRGRGGRGRGKKQVAELREGLATLLAAARGAEVVGYAEGEVAELGELAAGGLPDGHRLVLAERSADAAHPIVRQLEKQGRVVRVGSLEEGKGGDWHGLDLLARELSGQTGVGIDGDALEELARRTLKGDDDRKSKAADPDSASRFAGEYRKLATLAQGKAAQGKTGEAGGGGTPRITRALVQGSVTDRGEEDVWAILDAIGEGRAGEALARLDRMLSGAGDPVAARLTFFALLAGFCRTLTAVRGLMQLHGVRPGEGNYGRFKSSLADRLKGSLPGGGKSPVASLHPFRLHRAYLAAGRLPAEVVDHLPAWVLDTELELKGESGDPDTALSHLVARLAGAERQPVRTAGRGGGGRGGGGRASGRRR